MARALGWSSDLFDPADPGRLCRGRERWIESYAGADFPRMFRVMVSGASFSDDSARDAQRGLSCCGLSVAEVVGALFPSAVVLAWAEEGVPRLLPEDALWYEEFEVRRPGGPLVQPSVRWLMACPGAAEIDRALRAGAIALTIHDDAPMDAEGRPSSELVDALYRLTAFQQPGMPARHFQPVVIPEVLAHAQALVLLHEDKHAPCLGIYSLLEIDPHLVFEDLVEGRGILSVPFAIPPMLARWDRALWELHQDWDEDIQGPFPVPPAPQGGWGWGRRHRGRERGEE